MSGARHTVGGDREPKGSSPGGAGATPAGAQPAASLLLRLQVTAGNAAVGRLLARQPTIAAAPTVPAWHKGIPAALPADPQAEYDRLHKACVEVAVKQAAAAAALKGDMKYWFARVYQFVTEEELKQIDGGLYEYPLMKMQEVLAFHATYQRNLDRWRAGAKADVEPNWAKAFAAAEAMNAGSYIRPRSMEVMDALLPSMQAHIRFDLPRAIAQVYMDSYASIPGMSISLFKKDFDAMNIVFQRASDRLVPEVKAQSYFFDPGASQSLQDLGFPLIFHIGIERQLAWEKAELLAASAHSRSNADMNRRLRAYIIGAHPNTGTAHFEVDSDQIDDYDWNARP